MIVHNYEGIKELFKDKMGDKNPGWGFFRINKLRIYSYSNTMSMFGEFRILYR